MTCCQRTIHARCSWSASIPATTIPQTQHIITFSGEGGALSASRTDPVRVSGWSAPVAHQRGRRTYCGCTPDAANRVSNRVMAPCDNADEPWANHFLIILGPVTVVSAHND